MSPSKTRRRGHGDGALYQRASDDLWCASITLPPGPDGKRRRKTVTSRTREGAQAKLKKLRRELDRAGDLPTSSPTLAAWLTLWLDTVAAKRLRPKTLTGYHDDIRLHITPAIGRIRLDKLTSVHVYRMHDAITGKGNSSTTALRCHRILSVALRDAMRAGRVTRNVATTDFVDAPKVAVSDTALLSVAETVAVLEAASTDVLYGARWATTLLTGARRGEVLGVEADRVNLDADTLTLSWQLQRLPYAHGCKPACGRKRGADCPERYFRAPANYEKRQIKGGLHLVRPKTKAGWRVVPLVYPLRDILARQFAQRPDGLLFVEPDGDPIDPRDDGKRWAELLQRAGAKHVRMHDARHMAATLLMEAHVDPRVVMQILGHSSVLTTRGYQHVDVTLARDAMARMVQRLALD